MISTPTPRRATLRSVAAASATSYGYTLSIWASGALLMSHHGLPHLAGVLGFIAGAISAFTILALISRDASSEAEHDDDDRILAGTLHWLATGAAVATAASIAPLHGWTIWPLTAFAATSSYLLATSVQVATVARRRHRLERTRRQPPRRKYARDPQSPDRSLTHAR